MMVSCRHGGGSNTHGSLDLEVIPRGLHVYVRMCEEERADAVKRRSQDSHCEVGGVHEPDRCVEYSAIERKSSGFVRTMFRDLRVDNRCGKRLSWCRSVFVMRSRELHVCLALVIRSWTLQVRNSKCHYLSSHLASTATSSSPKHDGALWMLIY